MGPYSGGCFHSLRCMFNRPLEAYPGAAPSALAGEFKWSGTSMRPSADLIG